MFDPVLLIVLALMAPGFLLVVAVVGAYLTKGSQQRQDTDA